MFHNSTGDACNPSISYYFKMNFPVTLFVKVLLLINNPYNPSFMSAVVPVGIHLTRHFFHLTSFIDLRSIIILSKLFC